MITFGPGLVLLLTIKNTIFEKICRKRYAFMVLTLSGLKIILILLKEVTVFYVQNFIIKIRVLGFKKPIQSIFSKFY